MLTELNNIFLILGILIDVLSVFLEWAFIYETCRGFPIAEYSIYKKQSSAMFWTSSVILMIIWLSVEGQMENVVKVMTVFLVVWILSALIVLVLSVLLRISSTDKKRVRDTIKVFVIRAVIMFGVLWLIA